MQNGDSFPNELISFTDIVNNLGIHSLIVNFGSIEPPPNENYTLIIRGTVDEDQQDGQKEIIG